MPDPQNGQTDQPPAGATFGPPTMLAAAPAAAPVTVTEQPPAGATFGTPTPLAPPSTGNTGGVTGEWTEPTAAERLKASVAGPGMFLGTPVGEGGTWSDLYHDPVEFAKRLPANVWGLVDKSFVKPDALLTAEEKKNHPYVTGAAEFIGDLLTPANVFAGEALSGLSKLPGFAGKILPKLVSGRFSAEMVQSAYQNIPQFRSALADGNESEAKRIVMHMALDVAAAAMGGEHAITGEGPKPVFPGMDDAIRDYASKGMSRVKAVTDATVGKVGDMIANKLAAPLPEVQRAADAAKLTDLMRKVSPPSKAKAIEYGETLKTAEPQLRQVIQNHPDVSTPKEMVDAIQDHLDKQQNKIRQVAQQTRGYQQATMPDLADHVSDALDKLWDQSEGRYTEDEMQAAHDKVMGMIQPSGTEGETAPVPGLFQAENIRQRFNDDTKPSFGSNAPVVPAAEQAAKIEANKVLRQDIDAKYDQLKVPGVAPWRAESAALIDVRDQLAKAENASQGNPQEWGVINSLIKNLRWEAIPGLLGAGVGGELGGGLGTAVGAAGGVGVQVLGDYLHDRNRNPNTLIQRAAEHVKKAGGESGASLPGIPPVNHGLYSDLAAHYDEFPDETSYPDLEARFMKDVQAKRTAGELLEPAEKTLLKSINKHIAEQRTLLQEAQQAEAEKTAQENKTPQGGMMEQGSGPLIPIEPVGSYSMKANQPLMDIPNRPAGFSNQAVLEHELGHHAVAALEGLRATDIASHFHPDMTVGPNAGGAAGIGWKDEPYISDEKAAEKYTPAELLQNSKKWLAVYMGGAAANEVISGIPVEDNPGLKGDLKMAKNVLVASGIVNPAEQDALIREGFNRAKTHLTKPGISDIIKANAAVREENLDPKLHVSAGRLLKIAEQGGYDADAGDNEPNGQRGPKAQEGRPGKVGSDKNADAEGRSKTDEGKAENRSQTEREQLSPEAKKLIAEMPPNGQRPPVHAGDLSPEAAEIIRNQPPNGQRLAVAKAEDQALAEGIGAKIVGSTLTKTAPRDLDLRIDGPYDRDKINAELEKYGYDFRGSSVISTKEAGESGKPFGNPGWKRAEHFENAVGHKIDIWHNEPDE